jgi:hypothetical protein
MLTRYLDWPERLAKMITLADKKKFCLGVHDCCFFAADCILAITGTDVAKELRGMPLKPILKGFGSVEFLAAIKACDYQMKSIPPRTARRGDICLLNAGRGDTLGVCVGARVACPGDEGLVFFSLSTARAAWMVG